MLTLLAKEYSDFYHALQGDLAQPDSPRRQQWNSINELWLQEYQRDPEASAARHKAVMYRLIAEHCEPTIMPHSPFFFETVMRPPMNWGTPGDKNMCGAALYRQRISEDERHDLSRKIHLFQVSNPERLASFWSIYGGYFDTDHHTPGYTRIFQIGFEGIRAEILALPAQNDETEAMLAGIDALLKIATRFAEKAEAMLETETDSLVRRNLQMIASAARRVPAHPPQTFYEGLAMILFVREVMATLDAIGLSVLGRPDKLLIDLYRADLAAGRLTVPEAEELVAQWLLPHDEKTFVRERPWPENSTCIVLGGCDEDGNTVFNELTKMFIDLHCRMRLFTPKLNCRCSADSPKEYLDLISGYLRRGYNQFACLNDDVLVRALVRMGRLPAHARNYVNGGCQEPMCEGYEHTAGAFYYFNMVEAFRVFYHGIPTPDDPAAANAATELLLPPLDKEPPHFSNFYQEILRRYRRFLETSTGWLREKGEIFSEIHPSPLFSSTLDGCVDNGLDYTAGGARYNFTGIACMGLANIVNSLMVIKKAVYDDRLVSYDELRQIVADNWPASSEPLRQQLMALPRYGDDEPEVTELAARFMADICSLIRSCENERGEYYQPSFFVYYAFRSIGILTGPTPDGRRQGEVLAQGSAPSRNKAPDSITEVLASMSALDFADCPGNAVFDFQLPLTPHLTVPILSATLRSALASGVATVQPNLVDVEVLKDAQIHPEEHPDLTVRIAGLSALFVKLDKGIQDEIISRHLFQAG